MTAREFENTVRKAIKEAADRGEMETTVFFEVDDLKDVVPSVYSKLTNEHYNVALRGITSLRVGWGILN
jgi:chlorite dismutase